MTKGKLQKDKQYNDQRKTTKGETLKWPKENDKRTNIIMTKGKTTKVQTI